jgi:hypothetical protein
MCSAGDCLGLDIGGKGWERPSFYIQRDRIDIAWEWIILSTISYI